MGQSLQGQIAKYQPELYVITNSGMQLWLSDLQEQFSFPVNNSLSSASLGTIISNYPKQTSGGYILCDSNSVSANVAVSLSGLHPNTIVATPATQETIQNAGVSMFIDVRGKDTEWLWQNYADVSSSLPFSS